MLEKISAAHQEATIVAARPYSIYLGEIKEYPSKPTMNTQIMFNYTRT